MRSAFFLVTALLLHFYPFVSPQAQSSVNEVIKLSNGSVLLEDFESYPTGTIPDTWYNQKGDRRPALYEPENKQKYKYSVREEEGNKFLRYDGVHAKHLNFPLVKKGINIYETPILSWKWRVFKLPENANENDDDRNDTQPEYHVAF
ncbi:MAG: DUF3047 domain-containing protein [Fodinibius sp.]|nr:DUF3047 domain-containing protein [Fodinibius sp.]